MSMSFAVSALPLLFAVTAPDLTLFIGHYWVYTVPLSHLSNQTITPGLHHDVVSPWIVSTSYSICQSQSTSPAWISTLNQPFGLKAVCHLS